ncbi:hypothetical protein [Shewanella sp. 4_MG-2023]|uniref:hypothetical protein n=1 Tax=Shewanella sp. 4_MG-2023 TaxID=3062652 RepID=UPI0026E2841E|nr:hypothetical protein [Shewanella sp. 4_MG-2023]MDO6679147.1 hypothetical protein [Shewanella sp. 4_MG-2023]
MKGFIALIGLLISPFAISDPMSDVFGEGVLDTKWGYSIQQVHEAHPKGKSKSLNDIVWFEVKNSKEVLGFGRKNKKLHFSFDAEGRLNGAAVHFDDSQYGALLIKLETLFGEWTKGPASSVPYVQWKNDDGITLTLSSVPSGFSMEAVFSIGYANLEKSAPDKASLGF